MIDTLLRRIEQNPEANFSGVDLAELGQPTLGSLEKLRIIEALPIDVSVAGMTTADGRVLDLVDAGPGSELIDPDDLEFEPVPVDADALRRWRVNVQPLAELLRRANGLLGSSELLTPRLAFIGADGDQTAHILALYPSWLSAKSDIELLPGHMDSPSGRVTVCSRALDVPLAEAQSLAERGLSFAHLDSVGRIAVVERVGVGRAAKLAIKQPARGRPLGRGLGSLLDCWMNCHSLQSAFLSVNSFYAGVEQYLKGTPGVVSSVPPASRFTALLYNGKQLRLKAGGCTWHHHDSPPLASYLLSHKS